MSKPTINKIIPFDASYDYTVSMSYIGNIPYKNRIIIYNAKTLSVVYDHISDAGISLEHMIPANT